MNPENAIEVRNITKSFKVFLDKGHTLKELTLFSQRRKFERRIVLNGISFDVKKGDAIGLIGENGCGKSTTLKLLSRIMYSDSGTIEMRGRVSSLIELGAGFHPDMSGRQNIYTNASIFGLTRKEIDRRIEDIIAFSELEQFIDNPIRTYSSGMYMRLAFSVAINVDADILLIDEILGVGDQAFQQKCFDKLKEVKAKGVTIVIVSHALGQIEQICSRSIWIHNGTIVEEGVPRDVHPKYLDYMGERREFFAEKEAERKKADEEHKEQGQAAETMIIPDGQKQKRWGNGKARIQRISFFNRNKKEKTVFRSGEFMSIRVGYTVLEKIDDAILGIGIFQMDGLRCYGTNTRIDKLRRIDLKTDGEYVFNIEKLNLLPGEYSVDVAIEAGLNEQIDYYTNAVKFSVVSDLEDIGICRLDHEWDISRCF